MGGPLLTRAPWTAESRLHHVHPVPAGTALVVAAILSDSSTPEAVSEALAAHVERLRDPAGVDGRPRHECLPGRRQAQRRVTAA